MASLHAFIAAELAEPVDPRVSAMAGAIAARYPGAARAVLFYGSCLREKNLDGLLLDFYLIVSDYRAAYGRGWLAFANALIPPNVFPFELEGLTAKYAVLSEADFARECSIDATSVSVWARFAQPARLVWRPTRGARARAVAAVGEAAPTLFALALPMKRSHRDDPLAIFRAGFNPHLSVRAARRAQGAPRRAGRGRRGALRQDRLCSPRRARALSRSRFRNRGVALEMAQPQRQDPKPRPARQGHHHLCRRGRLSRLEDQPPRRHKLVVKPWQRRWPILGALILLPRLLRRGAIR